MKYLVLEIPPIGRIVLHELDERPMAEWYRAKLDGGYMERVVPYGWPKEIKVVRRDDKTGSATIRQFEFNADRKEFIVDEDGHAKGLLFNEVGAIMYNWSSPEYPARVSQPIIGTVLMLINFKLE